MANIQRAVNAERVVLKPSVKYHRRPASVSDMKAGNLLWRRGAIKIRLQSFNGAHCVETENTGETPMIPLARRDSCAEAEAS
jgi:hypothetical protein